MNISQEINKRTVKLTEILGDANSALTSKNSSTAENIDGVPESIEEIQINTGIQPEDLIDVEVISNNQDQIITPPEGKGYANITVKGDANLIENNIAKGKNLFGVVGTYPRLEDLATINVRSQAESQWVSIVDDADYANYPGIGYINILGEPNLVANVILNGRNIFGTIGNYKVQNVQNVNITSEGYISILPSNASAMERVRAYVCIPQQTLTKENWSYTFTSNGSYSFYPTKSNAYKGTGQINIVVNVPQNIIQNVINANLVAKTFTISKFPTTYYASSYSADGFNRVTINANTSGWAGKIKKGETILGITGTYDGVTNATFRNSITVNSKNTAQTINANSSTYNVDGFRQIIIPAQPGLTPSNIVNGVTICGVVGTYERSEEPVVPVAPRLQNKTNIIPTRNGLSITYDSGYDGLAKVTIKAEQNLQSQYIARGKTIFNVSGTYDGELQDTLYVYPNEEDMTYGPDEPGKTAVKQVRVIGTGKLQTGDWQTGYQDGLAASRSQIEQLEQEKAALQDSLETSQNEAYENGLQAGITQGQQESYEQIYDLQTQIDDLEKEVVEKYNLGLQEGEESGYNKGYSEGYSDGENQYPNLDLINY